MLAETWRRKAYVLFFGRETRIIDKNQGAESETCVVLCLNPSTEPLNLLSILNGEKQKEMPNTYLCHRLSCNMVNSGILLIVSPGIHCQAHAFKH